MMTIDINERQDAAVRNALVLMTMLFVAGRKEQITREKGPH